MKNVHIAVMLATGFSLVGRADWNWKKDDLGLDLVSSDRGWQGRVLALDWDFMGESMGAVGVGILRFGVSAGTSGRLMTRSQENSEPWTVAAAAFAQTSPDFYPDTDPIRGRKISVNDPIFRLSLRSAVDTVQSFDESVAAAGGEFKWINTTAKGVFSLLPELTAGLDYAKPLASDARSELDLEETQGDLRHSYRADWRIQLGAFSSQETVFDNIAVNLRFQYSSLVDPEEAIEDAGLDHAYRWDVRGEYELGDKINKRKFGVPVPAKVYLGWAQGRVLPATEDASTVYAAFSWNAETLFGKTAAE